MSLSPRQIEALRIAVAEIAGVKPRLEGYNCVSPIDGGICMSLEHREDCQEWLDNLPEGSWAKRHTVQPWYSYPNYTADLNAVHEVETGLGSSGKAIQYTMLVYARYGVLATALQRCIALVMTSRPEKWEEINGMEVDG